MADDLNKALYKKALGYTAEEEVQEFSGDNELIKRKITTKCIPPDTAAAKAYMEINPNIKKYQSMNINQLKKEARAIYKQIKEIMVDGD